MSSRSVRSVVNKHTQILRRAFGYGAAAAVVAWIGTAVLVTLGGSSAEHGVALDPAAVLRILYTEAGYVDLGAERGAV